MQEQTMSKQCTDYTFSPLLLLVPLPFVLAAFLPLDLDHSRAAPKEQRVAAMSTDHEPAAPAASAPHTVANTAANTAANRQYIAR
jgi:hypothetical protein